MPKPRVLIHVSQNRTRIEFTCGSPADKLAKARAHRDQHGGWVVSTETSWVFWFCPEYTRHDIFMDLPGNVEIHT